MSISRQHSFGFFLVKKKKKTGEKNRIEKNATSESVLFPRPFPPVQRRRNANRGLITTTTLITCHSIHCDTVIVSVYCAAGVQPTWVVRKSCAFPANNAFGCPGYNVLCDDIQT
eukprot:TRINITY_DN3064_c0_g1_i1.p1 TRINITY_DN3064_c0_g1~~TRINITY_DN3064_c0_g1_i1.p1  ORF type:complete len:114 (+),score=4.82 TRINITY_DN3064_c0_g1_i1:54-395(+)